MKLKRRERKRLYWRQVETQYFLSLCLERNVMGQLGVLKKGNAFERLSKDMRDVGFDKSARQCRTKLKHMKGDFKRLGRDMPFAEEIEQLLKNRHHPPETSEHKHVDGHSSNCCELANFNSFNILDIKTEVEDSDRDSDASVTYEENGLTDANVVETEDCKPLLLQDVSSIKTEIIDDSSTENKDNLQITSVTSLSNDHNSQCNELLNNLIKNQQKFVNDILEIQKKWNMDMIEKVYEHQRNQLKIIMKKVEMNDEKTSTQTSEHIQEKE